MRFCKKCVMPDTRPGITFDENGICIACQHAMKKKTVNWDERHKELENLCDKYRRKKRGEYDCIIAVSGGKDSHRQVYTMKEEMGMNPLLVTVEDLFTPTNAARHNIRNIAEAFHLHLIAFKPNPHAGKIISRYMFEKYGRPTWYFDRLLYTLPLYYASIFNLPLLVYGENVSYEYGGLDCEETYSAREQIFNNVAPDIDLNEFRQLGLTDDELIYLTTPNRDLLNKLDPIYLSYFIKWSDQSNYELAKQWGFKDLSGEWTRSNHIDNYSHIDSFGWGLGSWMKYPKFGHTFATDASSRLVRQGLITREEAVKLVEEKDHNLDQRVRDDFCAMTGMTTHEFYEALDKLYNRDIFEKNEFGQWRLKTEYYEKRRKGE